MHFRPFAACLTFCLIALAARPALSADMPSTTSGAAATSVTICEDLPTGELSDADLKKFVPDGAPGRIRITWKTESQEECYGFHIWRSDADNQPFHRITGAVIRGEGSTNVPMSYCYQDNTVERGKNYHYYIEELSLQGIATKIDATMGADGKGTPAHAKTIPEERAWLRKKARGEDTGTTVVADIAPTTRTAVAINPGAAATHGPAARRPAFIAAPQSTAPTPSDPLH